MVCCIMFISFKSYSMFLCMFICRVFFQSEINEFKPINCNICQKETCRSCCRETSKSEPFNFCYSKANCLAVLLRRPKYNKSERIFIRSVMSLQKGGPGARNVRGGPLLKVLKKVAEAIFSVRKQSDL